jgi:hypothetical protein
VGGEETGTAIGGPGARIVGGSLTDLSGPPAIAGRRKKEGA